MCQATRGEACGGKPLRAEQTFQAFGPQGQLADLTAVTLDGAPLLTIATEGADGTVTVTVTYGAAFNGIQRSRVTNDGTTVTGEIDRRAIEPLAAGGDPTKIRFTDGAPPPKVRIDPALARAIQEVLTQAKAEAEECDPDPAPRLQRISPYPVECTVKEAACHYAAYLCYKAAPAACVVTLWFYPACVAISYGICFVAQEICRRSIAHNPPCCPVRCGGSSEVFSSEPSCCHEGETCIDPRANDRGCCPPGFASCIGQTCCDEGTVCQSNGQCCSRGSSLCGEACCPDGSCQGGQCCTPPDVTCGGSCCPRFSSCCAGRCCAGVCTNGVCCTDPERYCNGRCCANNCCNGVCCAAGESCSPTTGGCAQVCQVREHACPNFPGNPPCCKIDRGFPIRTEECCPGVGCCAFGLRCCDDGFGRNVCKTSCIS